MQYHEIRPHRSQPQYTLLLFTSGLTASSLPERSPRLDEPAHGNALLSCGPQKLEPEQQLREFNADFVPRCPTFSDLGMISAVLLRVPGEHGVAVETLLDSDFLTAIGGECGKLGMPHGAQVFANYSWLSSGPPIRIAATELRGITIEQLSSLQLG